MILVTGGRGFIGEHVVNRLLQEGKKVRVMDKSAPSGAEISDIGLEYVVGDVSNRLDVQNALSGISTVIHLAAVASVEACNSDWAESSKSNYFGFVNLISSISNLNSTNPLQEISLVYASSAAVYGECKQTPLKESEFVKPISVYGHEKRMMEMSAELAGNLFNIKSVGLRFFNVYGPGQKAESPYSGVISRFINALITRTPIIIQGTGQQTRDFIHVFDVVEAVISSIDVASKNAPVYNVCSGNSVSILEIARILQSHAKNLTEIIHTPGRYGDIMESLGSPDNASEEIGFNAKVKLKDGLQNLIVDEMRKSKI